MHLHGSSFSNKAGLIKPALLFSQENICAIIRRMSSDRLLRTIATELPAIVRQLESENPQLHSAAHQRLCDFAAMTEAWRSQRRVSRRGLLRGAGVVTFAAMSLKRDD